MFKNTWLCIYLHPCKAVFEDKSEFKQEYSFAKGFWYKPVFGTVKKPQYNAQVKRVHQVVYNILVINYLDKRVFDYIYPSGETLASIAWELMVSYHSSIE